MKELTTLPRIDFVEERLGNGLRVILAEDHLTPIAAVNVWYNVGSRHETLGRTGLAHLFEHMMFEGSAHVGKTEHFRLISQAGGTLNGTTWVDRTNYFETVPSHHLEMVLWLEADRMGGLLEALGQETLDNQRAVVKNERRQSFDNRPYGTSWERLQAAVFPAGHPYHHSTIGSMDHLDAASLEDVREFFRTYYAPNNAVVSIVGDFDPDEVRFWVRRYFGGILANPSIPPAPVGAVGATIGGEVRQVVADRVPLARVYFGFRTPPYGTRDFDALTMASVLLAEGKSSRLYSRLVRGRVSLDAEFGAFEWVGGASMALGWATALPETSVDDLEKAFDEAVSSLANEEIGEEELMRARAMIERDELKSLTRVDGRADRLSMHATLFGDPERANQRLPALLAVTSEDIRRVARELFVPDNRTVLVYVPEQPPA